MFNYYLDEVREYFYTRLSDEDKIKFQGIKIDIKKKRKKWNYIIFLGVTLSLLVLFFLSRLQYGDWYLIAIAILLLFNSNNYRSDYNYKEWGSFLKKHILSGEVSREYQDLSGEQKEYFLVRDYVLEQVKQSIDFSIHDIDALVNHLIQHKANNNEFSNAKNKQYKYDEYHYFAILEEMKLRRMDDFSNLFSTRRRTSIFLLIWTLLIIPVAIIFNYLNRKIMNLGIVNIIVISVWLIVFLYCLLVWIFYNGSKTETIRRWEDYFISQGWDIFERPGFLFADWGTLDKYATFYFQKRFANSNVKHIDK